MALTDRQMASEDLRGGLWATRRNPTGQFSMPIDSMNLQQLQWNLDRVMGQRPGKELKTPMDIVLCLKQGLELMTEIVQRLVDGEEFPEPAAPYETPAAPPIKPAKLPARIKRELAQLEAEGKLLHQQEWFRSNGKAKPQAAKPAKHHLTASDPHSALSCMKPSAYFLKPGSESWSSTNSFPIWR